jgi:hypothetical protein
MKVLVLPLPAHSKGFFFFFLISMVLCFSVYFFILFYFLTSIFSLPITSYVFFILLAILAEERKQSKSKVN